MNDREKVSLLIFYSAFLRLVYGQSHTTTSAVSSATNISASTAMTLAKKDDPFEPSWSTISAVVASCLLSLGIAYFYLGQYKPNKKKARENHEKEVLASARSNNWVRVAAILKKHKDLDISVTDGEGNSVFHYIGLHNRWKKFNDILPGKYGNCLFHDLKNNKQETPIIYAVKSGKSQSVKDYLESFLGEENSLKKIVKGAGVQLFFHIIAQYCLDGELAEKLFSELGDLSIYQNGFLSSVERNNNTPLHVALRSNNRAFIDILLSQVASPSLIDVLDIKNQDNQKPIHIALENDLIELDYFQSLMNCLFVRCEIDSLQKVYDQVGQDGMEKSPCLIEKLSYLKKAIDEKKRQSESRVEVLSSMQFASEENLGEIEGAQSLFVQSAVLLPPPFPVPVDQAFAAVSTRVESVV